MNRMKPKTRASDRVSLGDALIAHLPQAWTRHAVTLPKNCFLVKMTVLDKPEPIKTRTKTED